MIKEKLVMVHMYAHFQLVMLLDKDVSDTIVTKKNRTHKFSISCKKSSHALTIDRKMNRTSHATTKMTR